MLRKGCWQKAVRVGKDRAQRLRKLLYYLFTQTISPRNLIPIPISTPQTFALLLFTATILFLALLLPSILELKKPKDAGPRRILESDGKEIIDFSLLSAIFSSEKPRGAPPFLEDIEPQEFESTGESSFFLSLPDIEF